MQVNNIYFAKQTPRSSIHETQGRGYLHLESYQLETSEITQIYRTDLRTRPPDVFFDYSHLDWSRLNWESIGRPYQTTNYATQKALWEKKHGRQMPLPIQWSHFNRNFHELFVSDFSEKTKLLRSEILRKLLRFDLRAADADMQELIMLRAWNYLHHKEDAIWDPRGKRQAFSELGLKKPNILLLGAGDGYDAMLLLSMYPGGHAVLVDFDGFCKTHRFGGFPGDYPFLAKDAKTGYWNVYTREDFDIDFEVCNIQDLGYGQEFDVVLSVGLIEHYSDEDKPLAFDFHRKFLKPGGVAIMTSTRDLPRWRTFYHLTRERLGYCYRELMDERQLGLYAHENGFTIRRCGVIKAHNFIVATER